MAKKRTKKQKQKAASRVKVSFQPQVEPQEQSRAIAQAPIQSKVTTKHFGLVDEKLVKKDLIKSLMVTCLLLILLFGMYWYLR